MPHASTVIVLTPEERAGLETLARSGRGRADLARRARIVLRLAAGASYAEIVHGLGESTRSIAKWKQRFLEARIAGLNGRYRKNVPTVLTPALEARILAWTQKPPANGATQWSTRTLAAALKLSSHTFVQRAWSNSNTKKSGTMYTLAVVSASLASTLRIRSSARMGNVM